MTNDPKSAEVTMRVDQITVRRGESLTILLDSSKSTPPVQVELRVMFDGTPQVFCRDPQALARPFSEWVHMYGQPPKEGSETR